MPAAPSRSDTIFALSSGRPPAAIAVVRISGAEAGAVLERLSGGAHEPRRARVAALRDPAGGELLDRALVLWMPGPDSVTGEDIAELHLHGGRAVIDGVMAVLARQPGLREAEAGEFTRRAFENGRLDLNEADGLADLLSAETQGQRRAALHAAGGTLSRRIEGWRERLLAISAAIEAAIDYSDEDDVGSGTFEAALVDVEALRVELEDMLAQPPAERLKDGVRVVVAGPPNCGKSSLVNALAGREAAIESAVAGTTRDIIEVPLAIDGVPFVLVDTAGLRDAQDEIEAVGVERAAAATAAADILLWLGDDPPPPGCVLALHTRADTRAPRSDRLAVSSRTGHNLDIVTKRLLQMAASLLPREGDVALNRRQRVHVGAMAAAMTRLLQTSDFLIAAEEARGALRASDSLSGRAGVEDMLDSLFSRFCVGK